jgi:hypothetical protein
LREQLFEDYAQGAPRTSQEALEPVETIDPLDFAVSLLIQELHRPQCPSQVHQYRLVFRASILTLLGQHCCERGKLADERTRMLSTPIGQQPMESMREAPSLALMSLASPTLRCRSQSRSFGFLVDGT